MIRRIYRFPKIGFENSQGDAVLQAPLDGLFDLRIRIPATCSAATGVNLAKPSSVRRGSSI
jgi:hypothetical protein